LDPLPFSRTTCPVYLSGQPVSAQLNAKKDLLTVLTITPVKFFQIRFNSGGVFRTCKSEGRAYYFHTTKYPLILGGDFNTSVQSQTYRLVNQYLNNAQWEAGCGFGFTYPSQAFRWKGIAPMPAIIRIDHIFYRNHFIARGARTLNESGGLYHLPVVADFIINRSCQISIE